MRRIGQISGLLAGMGLAVLTGCGAGVSPPAPMAAPVKVDPVTRNVVSRKVVLLGTVLAVTTSDVASGAAGKVIEYPIREGDHVGEGDLLAKLRDITLGIELEAARAKLREAQARYAQLQAGYREEEVREARSRALAAKAGYDYAETKLKRIRDLFRKNAVTDDELDQAVSDQLQAAQLYEEAIAVSQMKQAGYRPEEIAQALAASQAHEQEVLRLEDEMKKRTITAPFAGFVVRKHSDIGQWIEKGGTVATLVDLSNVDVVVNVEESLMNLVRLRQTVQVSFDAVDSQSRPAVVKDIVPRSQWQTGSRSFPVRLRLPNLMDAEGQPLLKEGMLARVTLQGEPHDALLVHKDAIVRSSGNPAVFRLGSDSRVVPVPVEERHSYGDRIEVVGQVNPGDQLVVEGNERLRPEQQVQVINESPQPKMAREDATQVQ